MSSVATPPVFAATSLDASVARKTSVRPLALVFAVVAVASSVVELGLRYGYMLPSESHIIFGGIRLHYLHVFPLSSSFLDNYLKSLIGNWFGWVGYVFGHVASVAMNAAGIPLSVWNLYLAHILMGIVALITLIMVIDRIYRDLPTTLRRRSMIAQVFSPSELVAHLEATGFVLERRVGIQLLNLPHTRIPL